MYNVRDQRRIGGINTISVMKIATKAVIIPESNSKNEIKKTAIPMATFTA